MRWHRTRTFSAGEYTSGRSIRHLACARRNPGTGRSRVPLLLNPSTNQAPWRAQRLCDCGALVCRSARRVGPRRGRPRLGRPAGLCAVCCAGNFARPAQGEMQDNPYELTLSGRAVRTADSPYTLVGIGTDAPLSRLRRAAAPKPAAVCPRRSGARRSVLAANAAPGIIGPDHTARQRMSGRGSHTSRAVRTGTGDAASLRNKRPGRNGTTRWLLATLPLGSQTGASMPAT